jgi:hypothetical protein
LRALLHFALRGGELLAGIVQLLLQLGLHELRPLTLLRPHEFLSFGGFRGHLPLYFVLELLLLLPQRVLLGLKSLEPRILLGEALLGGVYPNLPRVPVSCG